MTLARFLLCSRLQPPSLDVWRQGPEAPTLLASWVPEVEQTGLPLLLAVFLARLHCFKPSKNWHLVPETFQTWFWKTLKILGFVLIICLGGWEKPDKMFVQICSSSWITCVTQGCLYCWMYFLGNRDRLLASCSGAYRYYSWVFRGVARQSNQDRFFAE